MINPAGAPPSFSRIPFSFTVTGRGRAEGFLIRHLSPFAVGHIMKARKVEGVLTREGDVLVMVAGLSVGPEKTRRSFQRGSVTYLPLDGSIRFYLSDGESLRPMNHLGEITAGLEILMKARSGDSGTLEVLR
jgi:hypothetical protein